MPLSIARWCGSKACWNTTALAVVSKWTKYRGLLFIWNLLCSVILRARPKRINPRAYYSGKHRNTRPALLFISFALYCSYSEQFLASGHPFFHWMVGLLSADNFKTISKIPFLIRYDRLSCKPIITPRSWILVTGEAGINNLNETVFDRSIIKFTFLSFWISTTKYYRGKDLLRPEKVRRQIMTKRRAARDILNEVESSCITFGTQCRALTNSSCYIL